MVDEKTFLEEFNDTLNSEKPVGMDAVLSDIAEWDSISFVSFAALANSAFGKTLNSSTIMEAKTVADLYALVK